MRFALSSQQGEAQLSLLFCIDQYNDHIAFIKFSFSTRDNHRVAAQNSDQVTLERQIDLSDQMTNGRRRVVERVLKYLKRARLKAQQGLYSNSRQLSLDYLLNDCR